MLSRTYGAREHLVTLFRHKKLILTTLIVAILVGGPGSFLPSKVYEAKSRILLQHTRGQQNIAAVLTTPMGQSMEGQKDPIVTETEIFKSPLLLVGVAEELGPERVLEAMRWRWDWLRELPDRIKSAIRDGVMGLFSSDRQSSYENTLAEKAAQRIAAHLEVEPVLKANIFEVRLQAPDPEFAALVVNTMVDLYLKHNVTMLYEERARRVFSEESVRLKNLVNEAEDGLRLFKRKWGIVSIDAQKQLLLERANNAEAELKNAELQKLETEQRIAEIERLLSKESRAISLSTMSDRNPTLNRLNEKLAQLELELAKYTEGSPARQALDYEIASVRMQMESQKDTVPGSKALGINVTYQELQKNLAIEKSQYKAIQARFVLKEQIAGYREELEQLNQLAPRFRELARDLELKENTLKLYLKKYEESRISAMLESNRVSNVTPIEPAIPALKPVAPNKKRNLILGIIMGLLGGIGLAYIKEYFRRTFISREDIAFALNLDTTAAFPIMGSDPDCSAAMNLELRRFSAILRKTGQDQVRSLLVTSALEKEGKSFVVEKLARHLAAQGSSVLIISTDRPGPDARPARARESMSDGNTITTGHIHREEIPVQDVDAIKQALSREDREYILIDTPALNRSPEILSLASLVDGILFVILAENTSAYAAEKALTQLKAADANVIAAVLNGYRHVIPEWFYERFLQSSPYATK